MPPTNRIAFVRDFFFTDVMNHLEFLKWTGGLEKDDDVLLVHILERLAAGRDDGTVVTPMVQPTFYSSHVPHQAVPKNPLNIAVAYAQIQRLSGHEYNVFEYAYLDPAAYWLRASLAFCIQVGFFLCLLIYNVIDQRIAVTPDEDGFILVVFILFMSSVLFFSEIRRQRNDASDFNSVMMRFQKHYNHQLDSNHRMRAVWLHMNYWINGVLGLLIFTFNTYFILVSDNPTEAVLNSVALAFIIEIDDIFKPNWNEENKEDALAELLHPYISEPVADESAYVNVTVYSSSGQAGKGMKSNPDKQSTGSERSSGGKTGRGRPYQHVHNLQQNEGPKLWQWNGRATNSNGGDADDDDVNLYCHVGDFENETNSFAVHVYVAEDRVPTRYGPVTTSYESIDYFVAGPRAEELFEALKEFHCLENFDDIVNSAPRLPDKFDFEGGSNEREPLLDQA